MNDWKKIAARVERERELLRKQNDDPDGLLTAEQTASLRGRIRQCGWFLNLPSLMQQEAKDAKTTDSEETQDD